MDIAGRSIIVTGGANGIGEAMAVRFGASGAALVIVADLDEPGARRVADAVNAKGGRAVARCCNVAVEAEIQALVALALSEAGRIDLFCSNAGIIVEGGPEAPDADWTRAWQVNVMAHIYASRAALPAMLKQGGGYFLNTCSAAGLLTSLGAAPYAVSKHAAVAFSEWLAITYGDRGIKVSALCPQAVRTKMVADSMGGSAGNAVKSAGRIIEADVVASQVVDALAAERFLILTHEETAEFMQRKATNTDRWLAGMRKFLASQS